MLAQLVEHQSTKLSVVGSIPTHIPRKRSKPAFVTSMYLYFIEHDIKKTPSPGVVVSSPDIGIFLISGKKQS